MGRAWEGRWLRFWKWASRLSRSPGGPMRSRVPKFHLQTTLNDTVIALALATPYSFAAFIWGGIAAGRAKTFPDIKNLGTSYIRQGVAMPRRLGFLFKASALAVMLPLDVVNVEVHEPFVYFFCTGSSFAGHCGCCLLYWDFLCVRSRVQRHPRRRVLMRNRGAFGASNDITVSPMQRV